MMWDLEWYLTSIHMKNQQPGPPAPVPPPVPPGPFAPAMVNAVDPNFASPPAPPPPQPFGAMTSPHSFTSPSAYHSF